MSPLSPSRWYADGAAWRLIGLRFIPCLASLNLAWETAQLPLYTLWAEASPAYMSFSVVHCTLGDVILGAAALAVALIVTGAPELAGWRWRRIAAATAIGGTAYTVFSEWLNTAAVHNWAYSELMPIVSVLGAEIGLSPLAQWLLLPPLALRLVLLPTSRGGTP